MTDSTARLLARALFVVIAAMVLGAITAAFLLMAQGHQTPRELAPDIGFALATFVFPAVGYVIARRQPRNAVAWVLLGVGFAWGLGDVVGAFAEWASVAPGGSSSLVYAALFDSVLWVPGIAPLGTFLLLLFPDGHLPTARWRPWAWFCGVTMLLAFVLITFMPGPIESVLTQAPNPLGIPALGRLGELVFLPIMGIPVAFVGCAVALVRRYRRSAGVQRLQLKWLAAAAGIVAAVYAATMLSSMPYNWGGGDDIPLWVAVLQNLSLASFLLIPVAVGVAILRYRLYDIDRLINRALVYGAVSAVLVGVYFLGVVGAGAAMRAVTGSEQGNLAVASSTLAVAALFRPFRARVQRFIDRRFYRAKYNAALTVEAFSARLRQETELATLSQELRDVVTQTVQPTRVSVWIAARD